MSEAKDEFGERRDRLFDAMTNLADESKFNPEAIKKMYEKANMDIKKKILENIVKDIFKGKEPKILNVEELDARKERIFRILRTKTKRKDLLYFINLAEKAYAKATTPYSKLKYLNDIKQDWLGGRTLEDLEKELGINSTKGPEHSLVDLRF